MYIPLVVAACRGAASLRRGAVLVVLGITELTHCILDIADRNEDATVAYMRDAHVEYLEETERRCPDQVEAVIRVYDEVYGRGEFYAFLQGHYVKSLFGDVALSKSRRPRMEARLLALNRAQATAQAGADARAAREFRERKVEEQRQQEIAEREAEERRTALAKADRKTAVAERIAAETRAAAQKREQIEVAKRTFGVLRDKFYDCADGQLPGIVNLSESAEVLASTVMTICRQSFGQLQASASDEFTLE